MDILVLLRTATKVSEMLGNVNTSSALSAFEKMEEKGIVSFALDLILISFESASLMAMESQADALNQLTTDDLEGKFALLESSSVDDDLANLKKELSSSSKKGELPAGRAAATSTTSFPFRDSEIESELNELRRKTKEF
ncbi:hypothetical protein Pint_26014 [Pistacia integerrima]|uniref:Uncharacterized protein n=1 Tax=Pistacia integerrima TaxID=434235 RepID=A0ACC0YFR5_9ROSI|nr:hypothetical protein Pint_26014 [Pistacia integerrima]